MTKYAMPPIMAALEGRETRIRESLEAAEVALLKAEAISKDNEKALREAEQKAHQIRKEAKEDAGVFVPNELQKLKMKQSK